jgi:mono/diheme cytochrome c family protein
MMAMRRWMKRTGLGLLALLVGAAGVYAIAWWKTETALARVYTVSDPGLTLPEDAASLAHGRHLFETRGCDDCHGAGGVGRLVMDAGPVIRLVAPNITPRQLIARGYDADKVAAAIRHGLRADGTPLVFMPSDDWSDLSDHDTAALVAYMRTLPEADHTTDPIEIRPLARLLYFFGRFPLIPAEQVDHAPRERGAPAPAVSADYGRYVAAVCTGCHGREFAGGPPIVSGTPPVANLTPAALGTWSEGDFLRVMREGRRPDGRELHPIMPWKTFARMNDTELRAMWLHLRSLPSRVPES